MREIVDDQLLEKYLRRYNIRSLFDTRELHFNFYQFEAGEIINYLKNPADYLHFIVKGSIRFYQIRQDGALIPFRQEGPLLVLGDTEFSGCSDKQFYMEVKDQTLSAALSMKQYKKILEQDNCLLRFLLRSVSDKITAYSYEEETLQTVEERLLHYIQFDCPNKSITSVEEAMYKLRCSRRQLQRILKALTERNILTRTGKGQYSLVPEPDSSISGTTELKGGQYGRFI